MLFEHCDDICEDKNNCDNKSTFSLFDWNMQTRGVALGDTEVLWYVSTDKKERRKIKLKKAVSAAETAEGWGCSHHPLKVYKTWKSNESSFGEPLNNHRQSKYLSNHQKLRPIGRSHILLFNNCFDNFFLIVLCKHPTENHFFCFYFLANCFNKLSMSFWQTEFILFDQWD